MKVPTSTYRLQLNAEFRLSHVRELVPYLADLGISHLYLSPIFQARPRSPHGYDVTNPGLINREIGDEAEFAELSHALRDAGVGLILDIVPNHMAADAQNPWWRDVLEHGPASLAANFFDIAWDAPGCNGRIVLPVLGRDLEAAVTAGEVRIVFGPGELGITYFNRSFPLDPATYDVVLADIVGAESITDAARTIGPRLVRDAEAKQWRADSGRALKQQLRAWLEHDPRHAHLLEQRLAAFTAVELISLLEQQAYALDHWRTGAHRLNYRRFFDVTDLAAVRVEDSAVFATTHALILDLMQDKLIDGVRVDHVDGLRNPADYLQQLRSLVGDSYVVAEKILAPGEDLPERWPIEGTTGYDFLGLITGLYCHPDGLARLTESYTLRTDLPEFSDVAYESKRFVIGELFAAELRSLSSKLTHIAELSGLPFDRETLATCITEITAVMRVYRTYSNGEIDAYDRSVIKHAVTTARHRVPHIPDQAFVLLRNLLLCEDLPAVAHAARADFVADWEQFTGPVAAKGVEDTAFYRYHNLIALCEVGAQPNAQVASAEEFHETVRKRSRRWPYTMNASSTHDTKRSEDVRARIAVLPELADAWEAALTRWLKLAERHFQVCNDLRVPTTNDTMLIFQTLVGVWPLGDNHPIELLSRLRTFLRKAVREAKTFSSWSEPDECYENALFRFIEALLNDAEFTADFRSFHEQVAWLGALNSLSQLTLKLAIPGVPDIYQGNESWTFNLVDPDNRRAVDYKSLQTQVAALPTELASADAVALLRDWRDGRIKMHTTRAGLQLRRTQRELFVNGEFIPINARGRFAEHVIAFMRRLEDQWALVVVGRFYSSLGPRPVGAAWLDTALSLPANAPISWRNAFTNEITDGTALEAIFATLPFGILLGT